jgi:glycosyltransferase involved in cell wall biosynthesis
MHIAQLAPLWKGIPPKKYGGTELVVSLLTEDLVRRGHDVTLFACGESKTSAKLTSIIPKTLYKVLGDRFDFGDISYNILNAFACYKKAAEFDVIHNHLGHEALLFAPLIDAPVVTTLHSSLSPDFPHLAWAVKNENFVSASDAQRKNAPYLNYIATVYHGIEVEKFEFNERPKGYLFFFGTIAPTKGADIAVRVAKKLGIKLIMAGDQRAEFADFEKKMISPFIDGEQINFVGEINFAQKVEFYKNAKALIFPIRWNEAFGLVLPEAMACGTPVVAFDNGSVPEVVDEGVTGFVVKSGNEKALVSAIEKIDQLNRKKIRQVAKKRFSVSRMVDDYEKVYRKVLADCKD